MAPGPVNRTPSWLRAAVEGNTMSTVNSTVAMNKRFRLVLRRIPHQNRRSASNDAPASPPTLGTRQITALLQVC